MKRFTKISIMLIITIFVISMFLACNPTTNKPGDGGDGSGDGGDGSGDGGDGSGDGGDGGDGSGDAGNATEFQTELDEDFKSIPEAQLPEHWVGKVISSEETDGVVGVVRVDDFGYLAILEEVLGDDYGENATGSAWASFPLEVTKRGTLKFTVDHENTDDEYDPIPPVDKAQFFTNLDPSTLEDGSDPDATPDWENSGTRIEKEEVQKILEPGRYWLTWRAEKRGTGYYEDMFSILDVKFTPDAD